MLEMRDIHKRYGGVRALDGASLTALAGEVHGLLGPNGSGKSTMNKVLTGVVEPDQASVAIDGVPVRVRSPRDAAHHDVAAVYQQLSLLPELTVEQNVVLGVEPTRFGVLRRREIQALVHSSLERLATALGPDVRPGSLVRTLNPGQQQLVELAKALVRRPRILVLDEATASLHKAQVAEVFGIIRELCADGVCVLFVSHRMDEIYEICDRATVMRSGHSVATVTTSDTPERELVELMVGDTVGDDAVPAPPRGAMTSGLARQHGGDEGEPGAVRLEVRGLSGPGFDVVDLDVRAGEIVGLGGLQGQGQSELLHALFGAAPTTGGSVSLAGQPLRLRTPRHAAAAGIALVPGDRGTQGLLAARPIQENLSVVSLARRAWAGVVVRPRRERAAARRMVEAMQIKIGSLADPVSSLSGGNQQKVVLGKWLLAEPSLILLDDPTKGVDVGAKTEIYALVRELAAQGVAVIFNSSEDRELAELADRVVVLFEGRVTTEIGSDELDVDTLVSAALQVPAAGATISEEQL